MEIQLGPLGERPESYWSPRIAEACHLRPGDIGDLTLSQLYDAHSYSHPD